MKQTKSYMERTSCTWSEDSVRLMLTPSRPARASYFYIQEIGYFKTQYPYFTEREHLESFLIVYTISGTGYLEYEGEAYILKKNQCFFINCDKHHYYSTKEGEEWEFLWLHFDGMGALGYYRQFTADGFHPVYFKDGSFMKSSIERMIDWNKKRNVTTEISCDGLIHSLLTEMLLLNCTDNGEALFLPDFVKTAAKYIDLHFKEEIRLDDLAQMTNRSKFYFAREFKKYMGVTINGYIIDSRISYAKELLKDSDKPIGEIAYETGMNNVTHFINLFKARESITPLAYRKRWKR